MEAVNDRIETPMECETSNVEVITINETGNNTKNTERNTSENSEEENTEKNTEENGLDIVVRKLHDAFAGERVNVDNVNKILEAYESNPKDWKKFAKSDRYKYTRNLVDAGNGKFNLMLLCWGPSHQSSIHDHADAHCFMKMLEGSLQESQFAWPDSNLEPKLESGELEPMVQTGKSIAKLNEVMYINDSIGLHRIDNPSNSDGAVSLHLYCPPFAACSCFDESTGIRRKVPVTFWSEYGVKCRQNKCKKVEKC